MKRRFLSWLFAALSIIAPLWLFVATVHAQTFVLTNLHTFGSAPDAVLPCGNLIYGSSNTLFGVTFYGGESNCGTIYKINHDGSGYTILHSFTPGERTNSSYFPGVGGNALPLLQGRDRLLYGASRVGNTNNTGIIYKLDTDGSGYTVLRHFSGADGAPDSLIQASDGALYGAGTALFKINTDGGDYTVLRPFSSTNEGVWPYGLIQGSDGVLYGTLAKGSTNARGGAVFRVTTNGTGFAILHHFVLAADEGEVPFMLIQATDGALYGTTYAGGTGNRGTVFKINTNGSGYRVLRHLQSVVTQDAGSPICRLLQLGNVLYGTTIGGGTGGGTIFRIGLDGSGYEVVHRFATDGIRPVGGLTKGLGVLYGTTSTSAEGGGTVFTMLLNLPLSISPVTPQGPDGQTVVFWPAWADGYTLQMTTNLNSPNWTSVTSGVPVIGLQLTNNLPASHFRLVWP